MPSHPYECSKVLQPLADKAKAKEERQHEKCHNVQKYSIHGAKLRCGPPARKRPSRHSKSPPGWNNEVSSIVRSYTWIQNSLGSPQTCANTKAICPAPSQLKADSVAPGRCMHLGFPSFHYPLYQHGSVQSVETQLNLLSFLSKHECRSKSCDSL